MNPSSELDPSEYIPTLKLLRGIDFLQGVPEESLKGMLFTLEKQSAPSNKTILFQGEISNQMFIVTKGKVVISTKSKTEKILLAELTEGMYFGEISLLRPVSATATVKAGEEGAELLVLSHEALSELTKSMPDIQQRIQKVIDARIASKKEAKEANER